MMMYAEQKWILSWPGTCIRKCYNIFYRIFIITRSNIFYILSINIIEKSGFDKLPVCIAKTQYSFSTDPKLKGAPSGHVLPIREVRLSSGAGFVVAICGAIMTMPGLPRVPAADSIKLNKKGEIEGLF